jgi:voltage-gated potassium channel Kch
MKRTLRPQLKRIWGEIKWATLGILWLVSLSLGFLGFTRFAAENDLAFSFYDRLYRSLQLISMNSGAVDGQINWMLNVSRFLLPLLTAYTAFQAITNIFREQTQWLYLWRLREHVIVCGLGRKGSALVKNLIEKGYKLVVIEKQIDPITANDYRKRGVILLEADATDVDTLLAARLTRASYLVCLLGNDQLNLTIAHHAYHLLHEKPQRKLTCIVHLGSQELLDLVKQSELNLSEDNSFDLELFNTYQRVAHQLFADGSKWQNSSDKDINHILMVGLGRLGQNLVAEAAFNRYTQSPTRMLHLTLIDREIEGKISRLHAQYPKLNEVCTITPIRVDASSNILIKQAINETLQENPFDRVYICFGNPVLSLQVSLVLREIPQLANTPFFIRMENASGLTGLLDHPMTTQNTQNLLLPFDPYQETCSADLILGGFHELLARHLRENYLRNSGSPGIDVLDKIDWEDLDKEEKESNRQQACRIYTLLNAQGYQIHPLQDWDAGKRKFHKDDIEQMAKMEHRLWCEWKRRDGWRFGEPRDNENKIHPDLVAWENLPESEKVKNRDFITQIPTVLADLGFQVDVLNDPNP